jgi:hypothetical protein
MMLVPLEAGSLQITGVCIQMLGGCLEDNLTPLQGYHNYRKYFGPSGQRIQESEQAIFGKKPVQFIDEKSSSSVIPNNDWKQAIKIVDSLPVLELISTSLGSHKAITLFSGER